MEEQKEFKKKKLNEGDYKKDEKIVGRVKKVFGAIGAGLVAFAMILPQVLNVMANNNKKND